MSKSDLTTPVLIEVNNILYKLIYINFSEDGSIYVFFPRKKGYSVSKEKTLPDKIIGKLTISLDNYPEKVFSPYISYHPKSKSIHINTKNKDVYKLNAKVLSMAENKDVLAFPLCQILFPLFTILDTSLSNKYSHPFIIKSKTLHPDSCLNVEIFVHPIGTYLEWDSLPLDKVRRENSNPVGLARFDSEKLKSNTCTLAITVLKRKTESIENVKPRIIVAMFNDDRPYVFELMPNE
jgi:hypothetical protein